VVWKQVLRLRRTSQSAQESKEDSIAKEHNLSAGAGLDVSVSGTRICCELISVSYSNLIFVFRPIIRLAQADNE
jgi:hypothetical protein